MKKHEQSSGMGNGFGLLVSMSDFWESPFSLYLSFKSILSKLSSALSPPGTQGSKVKLNNLKRSCQIVSIFLFRRMPLCTKGHAQLTILASLFGDPFLFSVSFLYSHLPPLPSILTTGL